jgi:hypothetical protein
MQTNLPSPSSASQYRRTFNTSLPYLPRDDDPGISVDSLSTLPGVIVVGLSTLLGISVDGLSTLPGISVDGLSFVTALPSA